MKGSNMAMYKVNQGGVALAEKLIDDGAYDADTEWSDAAPTTDEANQKVESDGYDGYDGYGAWHLALDTPKRRRRRRTGMGSRMATSTR